MPELDPRVFLILILIATSLWVGNATVKGAKWVGHKAKQGVEKIVHPHRPLTTTKESK